MILDEIDPSLLDLAKQADEECKPIYDEIDNICFYHSNRILSASDRKRYYYGLYKA